MNIAYVVHCFPQLSESFILDQITGMIDLGHRVRIYAASKPASGPVHPQISEYGLLARTRYLPRVGRSKREMFWQALRALAARPAVMRWSLDSGRAPLGRAVRSLAKAHAFVWPPTWGQDIVHCQFGCVARDYWFSKQLWSARLIVSFRGHDFSSLPRAFGPALYRVLFRHVDAVTVVCRHAIERLIALGCPREKLVTHFSGTDIDEFSFVERCAASDGVVRVLTVARLEEAKGVEYGLAAVAKSIHQFGCNLQYGIAGDGSCRRRLEELAESLGIAPRVRFFGAQPRPRVRELMHEHHVFMLPSVTSSDGSQEGIPGSVREAMSTGMPVISTRHSGIPELVEDGVSGHLVPERDVSALADRLRELSSHPDRWAAMGRSGRRRIERHFEIRRLNERLDRLYRHVAERKLPADFEAKDPPC